MKKIYVYSLKDIPKYYNGIIIWKNNGVKAYYKNGNYHRKNGPAIIHPDETKYWYRNGKLHREDGLAIQWSDKLGFIGSYYLNNRRIQDENLYWFLVLTFIRNNKRIPEIYFK